MRIEIFACINAQPHDDFVTHDRSSWGDDAADAKSVLTPVVACVGKPLELKITYPADRFVAGFIGSVWLMNFLPVKVTATKRD